MTYIYKINELLTQRNRDKEEKNKWREREIWGEDEKSKQRTTAGKLTAFI